MREDEGGVLLLGDVHVEAHVGGLHDVARPRVQLDRRAVFLLLDPDQRDAVPENTTVPTVSRDVQSNCPVFSAAFISHRTHSRDLRGFCAARGRCGPSRLQCQNTWDHKVSNCKFSRFGKQAAQLPPCCAVTDCSPTQPGKKSQTFPSAVFAHARADQLNLPAREVLCSPSRPARS